MVIRNPKVLPSIAAVLISGCSENSHLQREYDPQIIAEAAITKLDEDSDGMLNEVELRDCPALYSARARMDSNHDEQLDVAEIASRVAAYSSMSEYIIAEV